MYYSLHSSFTGPVLVELSIWRQFLRAVTTSARCPVLKNKLNAIPTDFYERKTLFRLKKQAKKYEL
jgi:hypothetical protein